MSKAKTIVIHCNDGVDNSTETSSNLRLIVGDNELSGVYSVDVHEIEPNGTIKATIVCDVKLGKPND